MDFTLTGVINDLHLPWHDPRAVNLALDFFEDIGIQRLVLNGDIFDFHNVSRHKKKDPLVQSTLEDEFAVGREFFDYIQKHFVKKGVEVVYMLGNHEVWLNDYIINNCPAFYNMVTIDKQVNLSNIEVHPYNESYRLENSNVFIQHSPSSYSKTGPWPALNDKGDATFVWGCTHRIGRAAKGSSFNNLPDTDATTNLYYDGYFNGWLGSTTLSKEHWQVFNYTKKHTCKHWRHALTLISVHNKTEAQVTQYDLDRYRITCGSNVYVG